MTVGNVSFRKYSFVDEAACRYATFILFACFLYLFTPLAAWFLLFLSLGLLDRNAGDSIRRTIGILLVVVMATIVSSRKFGISESDDFASSYYPVFASIVNGNWSALFSYGKGLEIGLPFVWYVISIFRPEAGASELIFWAVLLSTGGFLLWLEKYGLTAFQNHQKAMVVGVSLLLCSYFLASQLTRQFFSSVILLFAISEKRILFKSFFLFLATLFHLTAIPIYLFVLLAKKRSLAITLFFPAGVIFVLCLNSFIQFVLAHQYVPGFEKALYILINAEPFNSADINAGKYFALVCIVVLSIFLIRRNRENSEVHQWRSVLLTTGFLYCAFLLIPQFSLRSTLLISQIMLGWLFALIVGASNWQLVRIFFFMILFNKTFALLTSSPGDEMGYWGQFHYWGIFPGYFL